MDTAIIAHPTTWVASGHVGSFADALIDDKVTGQRFRADKIIEAYIEKMHQDVKNNKEDIINGLTKLIENKQDLSLAKIKEWFDLLWEIRNKSVSKIILDMALKWLWKEMEDTKIINSEERNLADARDLVSNNEIEKFLEYKFNKPNLSPESRGNEWMHEFILEFIPNNPDTNKEAKWTECRNFNLMLDTHLWPVADDANKVYMRPETCQSLFTDFKLVTDTTRNRIPFGLAQIGKAFRNEITPGQFLFRTREFEQMEIEYFVPADPDEAMEFFEQWKADSWEYWTDVLKINPEHLRFKDHDKLAHYAAAATDVEYAFPWGFWEVQWVHNRTDFDLKQHQEFSKTNMQYVDPKTGARYIPWCIEASWGLGRQMMVAMMEFYDEEILDKWDGQTDTRIVVRFPFALAPVKFAVLPLLEKSEEMVDAARKVQKLLRQAGYNCEYDASGGIGKRYRRQDEIGTPYCITIDHQTLEDGTYTVRDRDTMWQLGEAGRMSIEQIAMLEYDFDESDLDCDDDYDDDVTASTQDKVCCGWGCGCH